MMAAALMPLKPLMPLRVFMPPPLGMITEFDG